MTLVLLEIWEGARNCCSVTKSCLTLCDRTNCSTPGSSVLQYPSEFAQTCVRRVSDAGQPSHPFFHLEVELIKSSEKHPAIWSPVLPVFPRAQSASCLISALNFWDVCWRSATAAASGFILVEADGKQQFLVGIIYDGRKALIGIKVNFKDDSHYSTRFWNLKVMVRILMGRWVRKNSLIQVLAN